MEVDQVKIPTVPETLLKKRKRYDEQKAKRIKSLLLEKNKAKSLKLSAFKRAEKYTKEYRIQKKQLHALKKTAKAGKNFYVPDEPKVAIVIRIRGINKVNPKVKKILQLLRLRQINNAVFIKINKATLNMLKIAEPMITWGYPNLKTIRSLIYKRGFAKINKQRYPLTNNAMIEKQLGRKDIICMEDLVHQIFKVGENFKLVSNFLWVFKLKNPKGGWRRKNNHYVEGGDFGNREDLINNLLMKMI
ncbi:large ribosomal subunit protein uL30-like [Gordionus sp. m RMFG-2023]|uniref:large ribosomal subunit protein uL30-like n=1 Tax=Gordionus sp. m RMFG-2023 TaxID=3053472 RepID=UPI0031FC36A3